MSVSVYIIGETTEELLEWNVANGNWGRILDVLGIDLGDDWSCGKFEGGSLQQLREKVVFVLDSIKAQPELDGGLVDYEHPRAPGQCRFIECGLPVGYFKDRLTRLLAIIDRAQAAGLPVRYS